MYKALLLAAAVPALTIPTPTQLDTRQAAPFQQEMSAWDAGAVSAYPIHSSCNATQRAQIAAGLNETILLADHAKQHVLRWGNSSELYQKYFGELPPYEVIGALDIIVNGDKSGVLFRCDNPDGNCQQAGWAGHWRGSNATSETVICDLSYQRRRWLSSMCGLGYTVADSPTNTFWASDLMHRLYHIPAVGGGYIEHWIETYEDALTFATNGSTTNTHDSDVLQYFALDAYAYDIAVPGTGCTGSESAAPAQAQSSTSATPSASAASSASSVPAVPAATSASPSASQVASQTSSAPAEHEAHEV
ncbi:Prenylated Rab acceptor protein 1 [Lithohypha guttulata]|uniref:Prenylated Rab acceptor protein 1 n=1 Tax=Lithohypha guttulata TaxID=1690604 RepID=A0AAN7SZ45_9EURO|nr:Prenylated Rab acceptor protein 1 [Lithohypha guttulata]KAK5106233.1 Prenylated Rab acceptor protein 1 [Lithohypha guttulata]